MRRLDENLTDTLNIHGGLKKIAELRNGWKKGECSEMLKY